MSDDNYKHFYCEACRHVCSKPWDECWCSHTDTFRPQEPGGNRRYAFPFMRMIEIDPTTALRTEESW